MAQIYCFLALQFATTSVNHLLSTRKFHLFLDPKKKRKFHLFDRWTSRLYLKLIKVTHQREGNHNGNFLNSSIHLQEIVAICEAP